MAKNKTNETESSVIDFINNSDDETKIKDAFELVNIMQKVSGFEPKMWGPSIIGFGSYHYKYASGHEGDAPLAAFSPRKAAISLYFHLPAEERENLLAKLGKHKAAKGCIYVKKLADIDVEILKKMVSISVKELQKQYPSN
ncbi:protein of unknown function (DU1801) [Flavobacterium resistens]|uniref:DUF1801 domain-containing protein n=1 Tax=Flavobacterium resistens TaxID=443612 RepID=A0A521DIZ2_9FLAO|nr:DUF1801 domain-containing protein [Flavobacterium resistens]MRX68704.1 DUF1801 domain-containing protein [Flavobacterium resistens]SMO70890.1 protein of unknown function (DU1801) [Flavobacterium resistens]